MTITTFLRDIEADSAGVTVLLKTEVNFEGNDRGISIRAEDYGDKTSAEGHGTPIYLEYANGELILRVWADINQEEPTHVIPLGRATELYRNNGDQ